jgi:hypothetical protein
MKSISLVIDFRLRLLPWEAVGNEIQPWAQLPS